MNYEAIFILLVFPIGAMQVERLNPSSLFMAVKNKNLEQVFTILNDSSEKGKKNLPILLKYQSQTHRRTPLLQATIDNNVLIASMLVAAGANIFTCDLTGTNSVSRAIHYRQKKIVQAFMSTPIQKEKKQLELALSKNYERSKLDANTDFFNGIIPCGGTKCDVHLPKHYWLQELADTISQKTINQHPERPHYIQHAPLYKKVARYFQEYYNAQTKKFIILAWNQPNSYLHSLPKEILNLVIELLVNEVPEPMKTIEKMPVK